MVEDSQLFVQCPAFLSVFNICKEPKFELFNEGKVKIFKILVSCSMLVWSIQLKLAGGTEQEEV